MQQACRNGREQAATPAWVGRLTLMLGWWLVTGSKRWWGNLQTRVQCKAWVRKRGAAPFAGGKTGGSC